MDELIAGVRWLFYLGVASFVLAVAMIAADKICGGKAGKS